MKCGLRSITKYLEVQDPKLNANVLQCAARSNGLRTISTLIGENVGNHSNNWSNTIGLKSELSRSLDLSIFGNFSPESTYTE